MFESKVLQCFVQADVERVKTFLSKPENFPHWASGMGQLKEKTDEHTWIAEAPQGGTATIRFTPPNEYGVADHTVTLADGTAIYIPVRVIRNGEGAEVQLTLFRLADMSEAVFVRDQEWVQKDLNTLKKLLEQG